jgi:hypothetical protein
MGGKCRDKGVCYGVLPERSIDHHQRRAEKDHVDGLFKAIDQMHCREH